METDTDPNPPPVHEAIALAPPLFYNVPKLPQLLAALAKAQGEFLPLVKTKVVKQKLKNKQTGEYTGQEIKFPYAPLSTMRDSYTPALSKYGLSFFQPLEQIGDRTYVITILAHEEGAMIVSRTEVSGAVSMKEYGGNITYARRYAAGPMLGVSGEDDADEHPELGGGPREDDFFDPGPRPARPAPVRKSAAAPPAKAAPAAKSAPGAALISPGQVKYLISKVGALKLDNQEFADFFARLDLPQLINENTTLEAFGRIKAEAERLRDEK